MQIYLIVATVLGVFVTLCGVAFLVHVANQEQKRTTEMNKTGQARD